jgi:hypothetical protein
MDHALKQLQISLAILRISLAIVLVIWVLHESGMLVMVPCLVLILTLHGLVPKTQVGYRS